MRCLYGVAVIPVFNFAFNRSVTNLDLRAGRSGIFTPGIERLDLREDALARVNELVRRVAPARPPFHADQIAGAARRVLRAAMKGQDSTFIKVRMRRAGENRAALNDVQWEVAAKFEGAMRAIVSYLDDTAGALIANDVPVIGSSSNCAVCAFRTMPMRWRPRPTSASDESSRRHGISCCVMAV